MMSSMHQKALTLAILLGSSATVSASMALPPQQYQSPPSYRTTVQPVQAAPVAPQYQVPAKLPPGGAACVEPHQSGDRALV
jgi:hypothetical protein